MKKRMVIVSTVLFFLAGVTGTVRGETIAIVDPHKEPATCSSCHGQNAPEEPGPTGGVALLADSIDETCHICHPYDCCRINSLKGHNHPSNVDKWDVEKFTVPKSLPLFDGKITCITCHYHRNTEIQDGGYRMVRLVETRLDKVDWTKLCLDCHINY